MHPATLRIDFEAKMAILSLKRKPLLLGLSHPSRACLGRPHKQERMLGPAHYFTTPSCRSLEVMTNPLALPGQQVGISISALHAAALFAAHHRG